MTKNDSKEKSPPVRKAKKGAWWKSLTPDSTEAKEKKTTTRTARTSRAKSNKAAQVPNTPPVPVEPSQPAPEGEEAVTLEEITAQPVVTELELIPSVVEPETTPAAPETDSVQVPAPAQSTEAQTDNPVEAAEEKEAAPPVEEVSKEPEQSPVDTTVHEADTSEQSVPSPVKEEEQEAPPQEEQTVAEETPEPAAPKKRRSRRGGKKRNKQQAEAAQPELSTEEEQPITTTLESESEEEKNGGPESAKEKQAPAKQVILKLLVNAEEPEECRIALIEDGRLESFHVTTVDREPTKNNIYKGRIVSIEANLQAAFVDIGTGRNGFLPFNEIHPEYYRQDVNERVRSLISQQQWKKLKIEDVMQRGQEVLVQVVKEVTGNKGANMTTYLSLPGRFLVLMPGSDSAGISRKIVGEERRAALREIMSQFDIPEGIGYIIRTASVDITHNALEKDISALLNLWQSIKRRGQTKEAPALVYEEQDTVVRFLRDQFTPEIREILVDTLESRDNVNDFIETLPAKQRDVKVRLHRGNKPIFNQFNIEEQIESIFKPQVALPSGGSIVINPTEALVAIDVNSGRTSKNADFDETIFLANMEAAAELARQLRLRDLGGLVVVDFIDMRNKKHIREVERQVKASMKRDKAKVDISKISRFGLMQISRQKMGAPIEKGSYRTCEYCQGRGVVRSVETLALYYLRRIQTGITRKKVARVECRLPLDVAQYLLNKKRAELSDLEAKHRAKIDIIPRYELKPAEHQLDFLESDTKNG
ncbi:Rne/Rng family ribonuclease [Desulfobulbus rhabdoformis]|uniref:Rne/Rng family ribonuclease n=1 Tax=Desulfobulbus rhabdoformis TaxID=34032 RepID=UPI001963880C|nr:Rne/Rng family ribonuclease [Desulfobulbus rhabdoformis]MBM9615330.1 Rne/Rng family ribonuclease [Desulfobulbus rhabdoformis]